ISGISTAIKESNSNVRVIGVEPTVANDTYLSIKKGKRISIGVPNTIADGLRTSVPGKRTFTIIKKYVDEIVLVSDEEIKSAFNLVLIHYKQLIEPSAAAAFAAALKREKKDKKVVVVSSGGS